jgi:hypothetical protein
MPGWSRWPSRSRIAIARQLAGYLWHVLQSEAPVRA